MSIKRAMGSHQSAAMKSDVWLTPPEIIRSLGEFDLDPCSPINRPWDTAKVHYNINDDGLSKDWFGDVWLNPPYGRLIARWMERMSVHCQGVALVFARTETAFFHRFIFPFADSILFFDGRLSFHNSAGIRAQANAGAPSILVGYGERNVQRIADSKLKGKHVLINSAPVIIVGISPTWKSVVRIALTRIGDAAPLADIYDMVECLAPDKCEKNRFHKDKVRQVLQECFIRISKGVYTVPENN